MEQEALKITQQFVGELKPQLKKALQEGGAAHAIQVCSEVAPKLAKQMSAKTGWFIHRVSLRSRHVQTATPDAWEEGVLKEFEKKQARGINPQTLMASKYDSKYFRFMRAQAVAPVCLLCHGKPTDPEVVKALKQYYPQDRATGYVLGEIRGAISLYKPL